MNWCVATVLVGWGAALHLSAATVHEDFAVQPLERGWRVFGDASLFVWNAINQNLEVTWNSARTNSYFHRPLGTVLSKSDDFSLAFTLRLSDLAMGTSPGKPYTFQIAAGFLAFSNATATNFFRGAGQSTLGPRNLVEFNYFPDSGFGATFAPTVVSTNNRIAFSDNHPLEMTIGDVFRIAMTFTASNQVLRTSITKNGIPFGLPPENTIADLDLSAHPDFRVDTVAVMSYSDAVQFGLPQFWGSITAQGTIDDLALTLPEPPVSHYTGTVSNGVWRGSFSTRPQWHYLLERSTDLVNWSAASAFLPGTGDRMEIADTNTLSAAAYYRIRAIKP